MSQLVQQLGMKQCKSKTEDCLSCHCIKVGRILECNKQRQYINQTELLRICSRLKYSINNAQSDASGAE